MDDSPELRRLRAANASLMNGNLSLLMAIRETDTEILDEWRRLQSLCEALEQRGIPVPASCAALTSGDVVDEEEMGSRAISSPIKSPLSPPRGGVKRPRDSDEDDSSQF
ncbi:hypothetical protein P43SY_002755 [Pythium insidiosum]|uniref:Uncharacterized protein n=1 Tax=Pythium insidiosum TaxID=114742 RepID=A0AAD5QDF9_PYTIN|nr:hypothetical protein P43SY_002755 [Pythium insidiosum]